MPDSEPETSASETGSAAGVGEQLRAARERRGLTLEQLADKLRLDESMLEALEADDFAVLGAPVFVRGHLKTCARQLGLDPAALLADYDRNGPPPEAPVPPPQPRATRSAGLGFSLAPWGAGLLTVLLAAGLLLYVLQGDPPADVARRSPPASAASPEPAELAPDLALGEPAAPRPEPEPQPALAAEPTPPPLALSPDAAAPVSRAPPAPVAPRAEPPVPAASAAAVEAPAPAAGQRLTFYFRDESWAEISDRNRRLLFGLQREGIRREISGEPPFQVLLGNGPAVDIYLNDEPYDLPAGSTRGKVARFVIEPPANRASP